MYREYKIWLKGDGYLSGTIRQEDAAKLKSLVGDRGTVFAFEEENGDEVVIDTEQIAVFSFGSRKPLGPPFIGFRSEIDRSDHG